MIAVQEELDWKAYASYGLVSHGEELLAAPQDLPGIALGERAFENALARSTAAGEAQTEWFRRHGSEPVPEVPEHWPGNYRDVVKRRLSAIPENPSLSLLEQPEYKRRWNAPSCDAVIRDLLYRATDLHKRAAWEELWVVQRLED
ncbi:hypothetical protein AB0K92_03170 [Streptomyces sp. NPDC052687]|uniref:DUF7008 domain-containing protein n=1 Tax=Streptomyces sp. NPDC052687 TaxID=3154759 RepID=UPI00343935DD